MSFDGPDRGGQHHGFLSHGTACSAWQTADELSLSPARTGEQPDRDAATSVASVGVWPGIFLFLSMQAAAVARIAPTAIGYWPAAAGTSERSLLRRPASGTF